MKSEDTVLSALAGYVDTPGFVALFGLFTAHVTGNFVLIGAGFAGYGYRYAGFRALLLPVAALVWLACAARPAPAAVRS